MIYSMLKTLILAVAFVALAVGSTFAAEPEELGDFTDWKAFVLSDGGQKVCWMVTKPKDSKPTNVKRGDIYMFVTHRPNHPAQPIKNEISIVTGYTYSAGSDVEANIDGSKKFSLSTQGDGAWLKTADDESRMIKAMRAGREAVIRGLSNRNTTTVDKYSLNGFTKAHKTISTACGVR